MSGFAGFDAEDSQQLDEIGIGGWVEDDEAGVDAGFAAVEPNGDRVRMPADPPGLLIDRDIVPLMQKPGRGKPGYARADDGDPQALG